ncbi:6-bladed beta-propeller [candidate division KSB1 bacterium]
MNYKLFLLTWLILFCSCSSEEATYTIEEEDGVKIIHNFKKFSPENYIAELQFTSKFGDLENKDENYNLYNALDLTKDNDGNFYIVDNGNHRIQVFDNSGKYIRTIGRQGQGPGEFTYPGNINIMNDSLFIIVNQLSQRADIFGFNGKYFKSINLNDRVISVLPFQNGKFIKIAGNLYMKDRIYSIIDESGEEIQEIGKAYFTGNDRNIDMNINICQAVVDNMKNVYVSFLRQNRIEKYDRYGKLILKSDREFGFPIEIRYRKQVLDGPQGKVSMDVPSLSKTGEEIDLDSNNNLWIAGYSTQDEYDSEGKIVNEAESVFEIYNSEGILLGWAKHPVDERFIKIIDSHAYFKHNESMSIKEYKIVYK